MLENDKRAQSFRFADGGSPALFVWKRRKFFRAWQVFLREFPIQKNELGKENKTEKESKTNEKERGFALPLAKRWQGIQGMRQRKPLAVDFAKGARNLALSLWEKESFEAVEQSNGEVDWLEGGAVGAVVAGISFFNS